MFLVKTWTGRVTCAGNKVRASRSLLPKAIIKWFLSITLTQTILLQMVSLVHYTVSSTVSAFRTITALILAWTRPSSFLPVLVYILTPVLSMYTTGLTFSITTVYQASV